MTIGFVAVIRTSSTTNGPALLAAGATAVLSWAELATSTEPDDVPAVLFDVLDLPELPDPLLRSGGDAPSGLVADLAAVLRTLISVDPVDDPVNDSAGAAPADGSVGPALGGSSSGGSVRTDRDVVIATVRPVIDTLKLVDGEGVLTGTAERDEHRFVGTPIATRLRVLRAVSRELESAAADPDDPRIGPTPVAVLAALAGRGATVLGSSH